MKSIKKVLLASLVLLFCFVLSGCQTQESKGQSNKPSDETAPLLKTENLAFRLNFNKIKISHDKKTFTGGTSLEELKQLFGEPNKHGQRPAGDVVLDSYTWEKDGASIEVHLYQNSTVARSIANFSFKRREKITKSDFQKLQTGTNYKQVVEQLGEPDGLFQSVSSDKEEIQAVWISGLKTKAASADIRLYFENDLLKTKLQNGLD
ncbi:DUF3862 domain-containing protein [Streptococcus orisasini]